MRKKGAKKGETRIDRDNRERQGRRGKNRKKESQGQTKRDR